jgi:hypothetical protein
MGRFHELSSKLERSTLTKPSLEPPSRFTTPVSHGFCNRLLLVVIGNSDVVIGLH